MTQQTNSSSIRELWAVNLGMIDYGEALALQKRLMTAKKAGEINVDFLLLLEHPAVITLGRRGDESNIVATDDELTQRQIQVHRIGRGGDVTYHGPGQLVGYPIVDLRYIPRQKDVSSFVWVLQEAIIRTLQSYGLTAERIHKIIGVWIRHPAPQIDELPWEPSYRTNVQNMLTPFNERKIAAIGARIQGWISYHGFALNINTDLTDFNLIVPCGLQTRGVTSMQAELGRHIPMVPIKIEIARHLAAQWGHRLVWKRAEVILDFGF